MKDFIVVTPKDKKCKIRLISARLEDSENLRQWKNANRRYFFHNKIITRFQQKKWMHGYFKDSSNFMFVIKYENNSIGCAGFRMRSDGADVYNVILAKEEFKKKGIMSRALKLMCSFIKETGIERIYLKVLKTNVAAQSWYGKNNFKKIKEQKDHFVMEFKRKDIEPVNIKTAKERAPR